MKDPNLLITNYCNQNCSFCFAKREMGNGALGKEMEIDDFKKLLEDVSWNKKQRGIKLLGGEPTLHSRLFEMIDLAVKHNLFVQIFTNGIINRVKRQKLASYGNHIGYTFNIMTPAFQTDRKVRTEVKNTVMELANKSRITLSITLDQSFNMKPFFNTANSSFLKHVNNIRIGFSNPEVGAHNRYVFESFPKVGSIFVDFIKTAREKGFLGEFHTNCGFTRCMFTQQQYDYVGSEISHIRWGCFGKESSMDVSVDLHAFHCFPLSEKKRIDLKKHDFLKANKELMKERMTSWSSLKNNMCKKCRFYGYGEEGCPGPCLAFLMNEKN